jgi:hypothetical protein
MDCLEEKDRREIMTEPDSTTAAESSQTQQEPTSSVYGLGAWPHRDEKPTPSEEPSQTDPAEDEPGPWRDGVVLSYKYKAVFEVPVDIQTAELPRWRPRSLGDYGRAAQDDE